MISRFVGEEECEVSSSDEKVEDSEKTMMVHGVSLCAEDMAKLATGRWLSTSV